LGSLLDARGKGLKKDLEAFSFLYHYYKGIFLEDFLTEKLVPGFTIKAFDIPRDDLHEECGGLGRNLSFIKVRWPELTKKLSQIFKKLFVSLPTSFSFSLGFLG
jgi:hypothetical protein